MIAAAQKAADSYTCYWESEDFLKRFWSKVRRVDDLDACWLWQGRSINNKGYALIGARGKRFLVHRVAYLIANGSFPDELKVLHRCDTPLCCNPKHLRLGTQKDNMDDMWSKKRGATGRRHGTHTTPQSWHLGERHHSAKLTSLQVLEIKKRLAQGEMRKTVALDYTVGVNAIQDIASGKCWGHLQVETTS